MTKTAPTMAMMMIITLLSRLNPCSSVLSGPIGMTNPKPMMTTMTMIVITDDKLTCIFPGWMPGSSVQAGPMMMTMTMNFMIVIKQYQN